MFELDCKLEDAHKSIFNLQRNMQPEPIAVYLKNTIIKYSNTTFLEGVMVGY